MGTPKEFIQYCRAALKPYGGKVVIIPQKKWQEELNCSGYYDAENCSIYIRSGYPDWLEILVHELSHHNQAAAKSKVWREYENCEYTLEEIFNDRKLKFYALPHFNLERDCEYRAVKLIKQLELDIDIEKYCKKANLILFKYCELYISGVYPAIEDEKAEQIVDKMPNKILPLVEYIKGVKNVSKLWS